jgi:hypothetical protein
MTFYVSMIFSENRFPLFGIMLDSDSGGFLYPAPRDWNGGVAQLARAEES